MPQQRVCNSEIAFGILEIDGIDLVRHGRGADLARLGLLPEITQRYVAPQIAVEIEEHRVGARERVELLGEAVVRLDLGGVRSELEAERLDKSPGEALPIEVRVRGDVSVVVAHRAVHLPGEGRSEERRVGKECREGWARDE